MAQRTTDLSIVGILGDNYDGETNLTEFIATAVVLTDKIAAADSNSVLDAAMLERIEAYLAAHFYTLHDPLPTAAKIGQSADTYGQRTSYWDVAARLDLSGFLTRLGKGSIQIKWLGIRRSDETEYVDRD